MIKIGIALIVIAIIYLLYSLIRKGYKKIKRQLHFAIAMKIGGIILILVKMYLLR